MSFRERLGENLNHVHAHTTLKSLSPTPNGLSCWFGLVHYQNTMRPLYPKPPLKEVEVSGSLDFGDVAATESLGLRYISPSTGDELGFGFRV